MINLKVMAHTITTVKISIKDSGRTVKEKDMGYSDTIVERYKKENIKETTIMVTIK
jgi:hypothetical protein